jgi:CRISPR/Cas system CSM-associated protein Csm3 (group 7 of RAMP superfamily)
MAFTARWRIQGLLTTEAPLHIGSGGTVARPELQRKTQAETPESVQVSAVATDHAGRAYIPGTTLKGDLLAWAEQHGLDAELKDVFGWYDPETREGRGGCGEFWDAHASAGVSVTPAPPYWSPERLTGVSASVALSRDRRTASDKKLFHQEYVPAGVPFKATISGSFDEGQVKALLTLLEIPGLALGAATGNGWGRVSWTLSNLHRLDVEGVRAWLAQPRSAGYAALRELPYEMRLAWAGDAATRARGLAGNAGTALTLDLELSFDGRFLVNDTSQTRKDVRDGPKAPDHAPRRDARGRPYLPASSLRGALRSQAERILRTLAGDAAACSPDKPCKAAEDLDNVRARCPACRVFGLSGWRAPLGVSDFVAVSSRAEMAEVTQDFLAIDRFTGGGANHLKFDARAAERPVLAGRLSLDPQALDRASAWPWALGLLALVLRDLAQGDVRFGFGAAKGYGGCRVRFTGWHLPAPDRWPETLREALQLETGHWPAIGTSPAAPAPDSPLGRALDAWIQRIPRGA